MKTDSGLWCGLVKTLEASPKADTCNISETISDFRVGTRRLPEYKNKLFQVTSKPVFGLSGWAEQCKDCQHKIIARVTHSLCCKPLPGQIIPTVFRLETLWDVPYKYHIDLCLSFSQNLMSPDIIVSYRGLANHNGSTRLPATTLQNHKCITPMVVSHCHPLSLDHRRPPSALELHREGFVCGLFQFVCNASSYCNTMHHHMSLQCTLCIITPRHQCTRDSLHCTWNQQANVATKKIKPCDITNIQHLRDFVT